MKSKELKQKEMIDYFCEILTKEATDSEHFSDVITLDAKRALGGGLLSELDVASICASLADAIHQQSQHRQMLDIYSRKILKFIPEKAKK